MRGGWRRKGKKKWGAETKDEEKSGMEMDGNGWK